MQAATTLIAWTPPDAAASGRGDWNQTAGTVRLIAWPDVTGEAQAYAQVDGACAAHWRSARHDDLVAQLFIVYAKMVLHGMNPLGAHLALSELDEYRDNLPPELALHRGERRRPADVLRLIDYRRPSSAA